MYGVLWLQDPVVFFWEEEEFGFHTHHTSRIEGSHTLVNWYTVVHFTVSHEDRSVPVLDEFVSRVAIVTVSLRSTVPRSTTVIEGWEPHFFGHHVHVFLVEDTSMSDESREAILVNTCQVINRETTITSTSSSYLAYVWFLLHVVYGQEIILHVQAHVVL